MTFDGSYPILAGYRGHIAGGWHVQFEDPLLFNQLTANLSVSPANNIQTGEQLHGDVSYSNLFWKVTYWHNDANFYDLFGPTDNSLRGDMIKLGYKTSPIYDPPRQLDFSASVAGYFGLDTVPGAQNIAARSSANIGSLRLALTIQTSPSRLARSTTSAAFWPTSPSMATARRRPLSARPRRVQFRLSARLGALLGLALQRRRDLRWRGGQSAQQPTTWVRSATTSSTMARSSATATSTVETFGGQADLNFTVALRLPMTLSFGIAEASSADSATTPEFMLSLKIL